MFVTGALCALHGMYRIQRYLNAKSFRHYANDAYSPYEVLHVIGFGQDHFYLQKIENGKTREGGIYRKRELRKKNREMRRALLEHGEQKEAHSAFIALCFRENIFLIFEEVSRKDRRRGRSDQRRRKGNVKGKGNIRGRRGGIHRGEEVNGVSLSEENIFFICEMMREIAIITITEASNNEICVLRGEGTMGEKRGYFRNTL